jgi:hypothetical protein
MTLINYTYNLVNGTPEDITQVMANFTTVRNVVNGNIDDSNIKAGAAIAQAKIAAGYLPSKLAQEGALSSQAMIWDGTKWAPGAQSSALLVKSAVEVDITSTTETDLFRYNVPGGTLGTDKTIWVHLHGTYTNNSGSARTFILRTKYGGTTIFDDGSISIPTNASDRAWSLDAYLTARGSAGSEILYGSITLSAGSGATAGIGDLTINDTLSSAFGGSATEDSTSAKDFALTYTASGSATLRIMWSMAVLLG